MAMTPAAAFVLVALITVGFWLAAYGLARLVEDYRCEEDRVAFWMRVVQAWIGMGAAIGVLGAVLQTFC